ncbi:MAG TPA: NADP-dependent phosphogluconate dehydrogenase [Candidatus Limnocylindrales bacterium]|nr:NADP-dependent phosphogluconate dehydrogenase [Candidatus Limnocylindrales bacterium]
MQIAILGLEKMGRMLTEKLLTAGHEVVVWNRTRESLDAIRIEDAEYVVNQKLILAYTIDELRNVLRKPRIVWCMMPSGEPTETVIQQLNGIIEAGDVVVNGGNANYKDTQRHFEEFEKRGIKFLGIGIAGGIHGSENGYSLTVGGNEDAYQFLVPVLDSLSEPNGIHGYFGTGGAGHFVKMVHNGIEYGMMQSIAEGLAILKKSDYQISLEDSVTAWQEGGIISSFLLDMVLDALSKDPEFSQFDGVIGSSLSGKWAVEQAKTTNISVPVIEQSLAFRERSQYDKAIQETFIAKALQAMLKEWKG